MPGKVISSTLQSACFLYKVAGFIIVSAKGELQQTAYNNVSAINAGACLSAPAVLAGDSEAFLPDMESDSDDEGSSFFVGGAGVIDSDDEGASRQDTVYMAQHADRMAQTSRGAAPITAAVSQADASHRTPLGPQQNSGTAAAQAAGSSAAPAASGKAAAPQKAPAAQKQKPASSKGFAFRFPPVAGSKAAKKGLPAQASSAAQVTAASKSSAAQMSAAPQRQTPQQGGACTAPAEDHACGAGRQQASADEQWEAETATDSDDEAGSAGSADFMSQYEAAMEAELSGSKVGATFAKPSQPHTGAAGETALPRSHARPDRATVPTLAAAEQTLWQSHG